MRSYRVMLAGAGATISAIWAKKISAAGDLARLAPAWLPAWPSALALFALSTLFSTTSRWALWLVLGLVVSVVQFAVATYQVARIALSIFVLLPAVAVVVVLGGL